MYSLYLADAGDGLCMRVGVIDETLQVDCGSEQGRVVALDGWERIARSFPETQTFLLSHFHLDHYNGLLQASLTRPKRWFRDIRQVFYPGIPSFPQRTEFVLALLAMNRLVFGSDSGVQAYDFLRAISKVTPSRFQYRPLFLGDTIRVGRSRFRILSPPRTLEPPTISAVKKALEAFSEALDADPRLRESYEQVKEEGSVEGLFPANEEDRWMDGLSGRSVDEGKDADILDRGDRRYSIGDRVRRANKALRDAANHFCLAFSMDSDLLFLGDLESVGLESVVAELESQDCRSLDVLVTPHHGTHWDDALDRITWNLAITSNGKNRSSDFVEKYKDRRRPSFATHANGDIVLSSRPRVMVGYPLLDADFARVGLMAVDRR